MNSNLLNLNFWGGGGKMYEAKYVKILLNPNWGEGKICVSPNFGKGVGKI